MPGLAGVFKMSNRDIDVSALLTKISKEMKREDWYATDVFVDKSIGMARVSLGIFNPETQPIFNEDKTLWIMMDGEVYDYENFKKNLVAKGHKFRVNNDPEFVLHLYEEYGKDFVHKLNGSFVLAIFDYKTQKLLVANDRYGLRPLYYTISNGYLLFAPEMEAILADKSFKRIVNDGAVSDFLFFRRILGTKTFLQGINLLPAASIMTCDVDEISIENYWDFNFQEDKNHREEYYIQKLSKLIQKTFERQLKGNHRIGASLTGGFDTRMAVANIVRKHGPIPTYTLGGAECKDVKFAAKVAKKLGLYHHFFEYRPDDFISPLKKETHLLGNIVDPDSFGLINRLEEIKSFLDVELCGYGGGELLRGGLINKQVESAKNENELFEIVCSRLLIDIPDELFNEEWHQKIKGTSINYLKSLFDKYNDKPLLQKAEHFLIRESLPSLIRSNFGIKNGYFEIRTPFYDNDLIDFIQTVPISLRKDSYIMTKVFLRLFPELAKISFEAAGHPIYTNQFQLIKRVLWRLLRKLKVTLSHLPLFSSRFRNYRIVDYSQWLKENRQVQEYVKEILLSPEAKSRGYFKPEAIQKILKEQFSGKKDNWTLITRLVILELWHRIFLEFKFEAKENNEFVRIYRVNYDQR